ncbi:nicotinamide N-methyltransferase-like isoform X2 [Eublepharis macularius]|uniref:Nicotinamide N-methyltransferase-like isoform X2 n=1 Tax=Eublepharis macularius TaxID=481883 RepID=A0AA97KDU2_EUBMA|nr:nicotinamide N-methyltransferase-like isoform X2 [Eublepharis macularius]
MAAAFTKKDYYDRHFIPKAFLEMYFAFHPEKAKGTALLVFGLKKLYKAFNSGGIKGDTLIDIGSGPTIYQFLSACESFREIIASDYTDGNREEMQRWLRKEPGAFDWSPVVKYLCEMEGDREKWIEKEEKVRKAIKRVLKCDVTQPNPLAPLSLPPADCVLCTRCLEAACTDLPTYHSALKNMSSLIKPGGHLVFFAVLESTFYMVGQHRFSNLYVDQKCVEEAVKEAGFDIEWLEGTKFNYPATVFDAKGACVLVARKR